MNQFTLARVNFWQYDICVLLVSTQMYLAKFEGHCSAVNDIRMDEFARNYPLLDDSAVHARWKSGSWQITRIGDIWKRTGKIFAVPYDGAETYPSFQFDEDGTPLPLMEPILEALPEEVTPWQCAFWMTTPHAELGGETPANCLQTGDGRVVDVASYAGARLLR
ncbi:antitoxin Xre/MbcA/ParS toxin-binding domain-containing protein [Ruegeria lacuscaerulensis]|uniref:antitoxin Xre/MbcA/ParS toxin-binding domain-containing protein n=1 Tax=Ruegeria lacuscaerulensis TaxID=55218 RepID=UPI00147F7958|nr:antitoxin Xre/MbcA/ParS toxin-binding domain-containing protein [Ruegeria lacuscaerulensis]